MTGRRRDGLRARPYVWQTIPRVKAALLREAGGKCAYCETKVGVAGYARVEQIQPREGLRSIARDLGVSHETVRVLLRADTAARKR